MTIRRGVEYRSPSQRRPPADERACPMSSIRNLSLPSQWRFQIPAQIHPKFILTSRSVVIQKHPSETLRSEYLLRLRYRSPSHRRQGAPPDPFPLVWHSPILLTHVSTRSQSGRNAVVWPPSAVASVVAARAAVGRAGGCVGYFRAVRGAAGAGAVDPRAAPMAH
jgi:hypothetical protein